MCAAGTIENRGPVASPLEAPTFSEEEPGAPEEVSDAPYQRGSAPGHSRSQPARDQQLLPLSHHVPFAGKHVLLAPPQLVALVLEGRQIQNSGQVGFQ